ncbi:endonuclease/exonuclease/phosphatase family protein [Streptomyces sp. NPDC047017]|uniref:endonuclease/exonuclease/phosphatase family protein n=1 Tax=Streptomyces sp. NPDC047017 TaxID=3155024 RepID=UPI0034008F3F
MAKGVTPVSRAAEPGRELTVVTFNIHHGADPDEVLDLERIARVVQDAGADVIGLQEVDRHWSARSGHVDQAAWLAGRLDLHLAYGANLDLDPRRPGDPRRRYGTAILSRFPLLDPRNTPLPRSPEGEQRGLLAADIAVRGTRLRFLTTHLEFLSRGERLAQVAAINDLVDASRRPTVLVGDLNTTPDSEEITTLTRRLRDTWPLAGHGSGFTHEARTPTARIDYVLASPTLHAHHAQVLPTTASDHRPVRVELTLAAGP